MFFNIFLVFFYVFLLLGWLKGYLNPFMFHNELLFPLVYLS